MSFKSLAVGLIYEENCSVCNQVVYFRNYLSIMPWQKQIVVSFGAQVTVSARLLYARADVTLGFFTLEPTWLGFPLARTHCVKVAGVSNVSSWNSGAALLTSLSSPPCLTTPTEWPTLSTGAITCDPVRQRDPAVFSSTADTDVDYWLTS